MVLQRRVLKRRDYERMGIPATLWSVDANKVPPGALMFLRRYAGRLEELLRRPAGAYFLGPKGVGKTGAAVLLLKYIKEHGFSCLFISVGELRQALRGRVQFDTDTSVWDRAKEVDALVLDELRAADAGEAVLGARDLEDLLEHRYQFRKATFITTRMTVSERLSTFAGLVSKTTGYLVDVPVDGQDQREALKNSLTESLVAESATPPSSSHRPAPVPPNKTRGHY